MRALLLGVSMGLAVVAAADEPPGRFGRVVGADVLEGIEPPSGVTTAMLGRRHGDGLAELPEGIRVVTRCSRNACIDGLSAGGRPLVAPALGKEQARTYAQGDAWLERVIRVVWPGPDVVSIYLAESEYSGGAHANNWMACRTYDRRSGRVLRLRDLLPAASARRVLSRLAPLLADTDRGIDVLGAVVPAGYALDERGFRLGRGDAARGNGPDIILCAETSGPRAGTVLEIPLDAIPTRYLLSGQ